MESDTGNVGANEYVRAHPPRGNSPHPAAFLPRARTTVERGNEPGVPGCTRTCADLATRGTVHAVVRAPVRFSHGHAARAWRVGRGGDGGLGAAAFGSGRCMRGATVITSRCTCMGPCPTPHSRPRNYYYRFLLPSQP